MWSRTSSPPLGEALTYARSTAGPALALRESRAEQSSTLSAACFVVDACSIASKLSPTKLQGRRGSRISSTCASRAIGHLRPKDQEILRLILWDQIGRSDVAVILACSTNAVDVRFHRALKRLRARFAITQATGGVGCDPKPAPEY